ncbi:hypothetical protein COLO4_36584 [Corchorus olitorius]|uniref:Uncharacterized protein n=1 Tax=Corchorus olitorius TaxID=93759 RepID=A0A1R3G7U7_9ROSI|nr:hypothetical protein COLO4_36584 [Corchorus olitorius]
MVRSLCPFTEPVEIGLGENCDGFDELARWNPHQVQHGS